jgi:PAS domain S-box-containing protein
MQSADAAGARLLASSLFGAATWAFLLAALTLLCATPLMAHDGQSAEDRLRNEQMLASILKSAPTGIGVVENRVIVQVNDYILDLTGYTREELIGQSARMLYPTQDEFDFVGREKYRQISAQGTGSVETRWLRKDGSIRHVILSSTPLDPSNLDVGVTFTVLDITARKEAETQQAVMFSALRESEERFRTLFVNHGAVSLLIEPLSGPHHRRQPGRSQILRMEPRGAGGDAHPGHQHPLRR